MGPLFNKFLKTIKLSQSLNISFSYLGHKADKLSMFYLNAYLRQPLRKLDWDKIRLIKSEINCYDIMCNK